MMSDERRDLADEMHDRKVREAVASCTPEGCHNRFCPDCHGHSDARRSELTEAVWLARAAAKVADDRYENAVQALDAYEVSLGLPSILR